VDVKTATVDFCVGVLFVFSDWEVEVAIVSTRLIGSNGGSTKLGDEESGE
jgi:hypothetical protein